MAARSRFYTVTSALIAMAAGIAVFNTIIGVFGMTPSVVALTLFIAVVIVLAFVRQPEDGK